jgi:hypothetical protein
MILLLITSALALLGIVSTLVTVARDGYRPVRTDVTRLP